MEIKQANLVLADISGYTKFTKQHTISLIHAEKIITELMESIIDVSDHPLKVTKLEGDAVFFYALPGNDREASARDVFQQVMTFFQAFKAKDAELVINLAYT